MHCQDYLSAVLNSAYLTKLVELPKSLYSRSTSDFENLNAICQSASNTTCAFVERLQLTAHRVVVTLAFLVSVYPPQTEVEIAGAAKFREKFLTRLLLAVGPHFMSDPLRWVCNTEFHILAFNPKT